MLWGEAPRTLSGDALLRAIESMPEGPAPLKRLKTASRPLAVVISDFWDDVRGDLAFSGQLSLIRVLGRDEIDPPARGMARLTDSETGEGVDRFVGDEELKSYRRLLDEDERGWRAWAHEREVTFLRCAADEPIDKVLMVYLRGEGVLE